MQRVRVGLTGLACVFLLVLLAAAFFGLTNDERETGSLTPATVPASNTVAAEAPREPLAELGVTPGYAGEAAGNEVAGKPPPSDAPAPAPTMPAAAAPPPPPR